MISEERKFEIESEIRKAVPRELFVDILQDFPAAAEQADRAISESHKGVMNGVELRRARQAKAVGLVRYQILDEVFEAALLRHGAEAVRSVQVELKPEEMKDVRLHLTTARMGNILIGFASHRELLDAPVKNATRRALCYQNRGLSADLFHGTEMFRDRQRFVSIMVRRDPMVLGKIASMTISVLDSRCESFLFQSDIADFLAGYGAAGGSEVLGAKPATKLRPVDGSFKDRARKRTAEGK